ncbi:unnamed protein product, partial [Ectocarpus sp. 12 AP-2014]
MVDFRPLLFINALALMLLVTAGFASVREDKPLVDAFSAEAPTQSRPAPEPEPEPEQLYESPQDTPVTVDAPREAITAEPFSISPMPENPTVVARAEPPSAMNTRTDVAPEPVAPPPSTGKLVLRSNVVGDKVTINGRQYGATRLDLELDPGRYEVTISKDGFKPWSQTVAMEAGQNRTLVGKLEAYTTVNFRDGTWIGGVRTGDGNYKDSN